MRVSGAATGVFGVFDTVTRCSTTSGAGHMLIITLTGQLAGRPATLTLGQDTFNTYRRPGSRFLPCSSPSWRQSWPTRGWTSSFPAEQLVGGALVLIGIALAQTAR